MQNPSDPSTQGIDALIDAAMRPLADSASNFIFFSIEMFGTPVPLIVLWLVAGGVFFTVYLRFINFRGFRHAIELVSGKHVEADDPGQISQFQALTTAVSGTVGIGNIAGVAVAISIGGPGATFWLIVAGLLGMSTKLAECTLGVMFRRYEGGVVSGGPMYYLERGLTERNWPKLGRGLGIFYAASMVIGCLGIGNMFQSNQAAAIFINVTGGADSWFADQSWLLGFALALGVGAVIIGGIQSIAITTARLVPAMALLYVVTALLVIAMNYEALPGAFAAIWNGAFDPQGISGGIIGVMIIGFRRAVFSNEAGLGSAAIAHSTARTKEPVSEGFVALLEPFIDTVVICTITALVIITTVYDPSLGSENMAGIELTTQAFASTLSWSPIPLSVAAILFAYSTMIAWSYYGLKAFTYLVGNHRIADISFKLFFLAFVVLGASIELSSLIDLSDAMVFIVAIPNLLGLYLLAPLIKTELIKYEAKHLD
ncbi:MAG: alanine/glycine:cation symporter family protein [Pseudomonadales bacterium]|jgi:AGCS family alanine or glycine:cation symporter|nr:alanine/glycine:cation symporter family protein [Pseudomonadales bacterium]